MPHPFGLHDLAASAGLDVQLIDRTAIVGEFGVLPHAPFARPQRLPRWVIRNRQRPRGPARRRRLGQGRRRGAAHGEHQASLRTRFALGQGLSAIAEAIDWDIEANSPGPVYATLFVAIFDPSTRRMRYVNAGHNPQLVRRSDGGLERMSSTGLPVGLLAGHGYSEREVQLAPGDLLFFYTDGCVEMENEGADMFGAERLESLVAASGRGSADAVLATVETAIASFRGGRDLFDDATMMAVTVG